MELANPRTPKHKHTLPIAGFVLTTCRKCNARAMEQRRCETCGKVICQTCGWTR